MVSRSGAFVFYIGDHYFGTLVAYVAGQKAADYKFTSALPVQILKVLAPTLKQRLKLGVDPQRTLMTRRKPISNDSGIVMVKQKKVLAKYRPTKQNGNDFRFFVRQSYHCVKRDIY